jgi:hypothetical protein
MRGMLFSIFLIVVFPAVAAVSTKSFAEGAPRPADAAPNVDHDASAPPRPENGSWSVGTARWFVSTKSDLGVPYVKPYVSFGYGMPQWIWAGVDLNAIATMEFVQAYAGLRASLPIFDLAFGLRDTQSFQKPFLRPAMTFSRDDVLNGESPKARYWGWEAEAVGIVPLPYSAVVVDLIAVRTLDVPDDRYVYEESYRAVVARPFFAVLRFAAVARLLHEDALKAGILSEYVVFTGRDRGVVRVGPAAQIQLTDHLQGLGTLTLAVSSPDALGLALGAYGVAGLRYEWASGERHPKAPWRGFFIP